jgi:putative ABC transport system substrate-binding protein
MPVSTSLLRVKQNCCKRAQIDVRDPTEVARVRNLKTAKALGLAFPISLLGRADEVIE